MAGPETRVEVPEGVLFRELDGEAVLLNVESGRYFGLDPVGTSMWRELVDRGSVGEAHRALADSYRVAPERLLEDLVALVDKLVSHGLLRAHEP